ncbi:hypothetical protein PHMEG_00011860 [Phytophthora megakarya]|uniref:Uncharacterized protein n=1 Tax=Phytophthora megakarya TaxID=4795 RepID=A0A225WA82_9STRA|nr:hypothetical protein PHMEG_00011860 [Phytophthora megakarya]
MRQTQEALTRIQSELAQKHQADEAIMAAHAEAAIQAERLRAAKETEDGLKAQHFQTEADFAERLRVQHATVTPVPDAVSQITTESGIANFQQDAKGHDAGNVAVKKEKSADKEVAVARADALLAAQLQATLQSVNVAKATKATAPKSSDDAKVKAKKATPKASASKKARRGGYPSDSDPSSEDDDSDSSSDDSDSSFCEPLSEMVVPKATQGGTTTMTIRPFMTASFLDDFDEKLLSRNALVAILFGKELAFTIVSACAA